MKSTEEKTMEDRKKKITYILSQLSKEASVSECSECGELMVCPLEFDMNPICSKVECNYKLLKNYENTKYRKMVGGVNG
ncbi:MAG: hypothetical protein AAB922_07770 [Patescibacteria group bacterium]